MLLLVAGCNEYEGIVLDEDFDIPRTEAFADTLSSYALYQGDLANLTPAEGVYEYELASALFTDYAAKQRLMKLPAGEQLTTSGDGIPVFPEGAILAKTFYYDDAIGDSETRRHIIETRLLVLKQGRWNVATYVWSDAQDEAFLLLDGKTTPVSWRTPEGAARRINYEIPSEVACVTCHQDNDVVSPIGPALRNLNRPGAGGVNQLTQLQTEGLLSAITPEDVTPVVDYTDTSESLEDRARAYLHGNCAHCHSPSAWDRPSREVVLDLSFGTPLDDTGILSNLKRVRNALTAGEMPYIGTTLVHDEGVQLVVEYLDTL